MTLEEARLKPNGQPFSNPHRLRWRYTLKEFCGSSDLNSRSVQRVLLDSVQPACCDEGCEVEPDGQCEHGCPSVSIAMGVV